jgi:hypothetical protein
MYTSRKPMKVTNATPYVTITPKRSVGNYLSSNQNNVTFSGWIFQIISQYVYFVKFMYKLSVVVLSLCLVVCLLCFPLCVLLAGSLCDSGLIHLHVECSVPFSFLCLFSLFLSVVHISRLFVVCCLPFTLRVYVLLKCLKFVPLPILSQTEFIRSFLLLNWCCWLFLVV